MKWILSDTEAAALIESFGRRVPRVMLEEIQHDSLFKGHAELDAIAEKHGVKLEGWCGIQS